MPVRTFTDVRIVAKHVPETHRTLENDLTVTEVELPGTVELYFWIDGGLVPFTHLRGADVIEAIDRAGAEQKAQETASPAPETTTE